MEAKRLLRSRLLAARAARSAAQMSLAEAAIAEHGMTLCQGVSSVAAFAAVRSEPPTRTLLERLRAAGVAVVLPLVRDTGLQWAPYDGWDRLRPADFGLLEPQTPLAAPNVLSGVDLVLAPALAVDGHGNRLGWGKGHYDRVLATVEPEQVVAVVYDDEVLDRVPVEEHDRRVGAVLTPSGLRRLGS